jgi:hypothetical protein
MTQNVGLMSNLPIAYGIFDCQIDSHCLASVSSLWNTNAFFYDTHDAWLLGFCGLFLFKALMTRLQEMCITNDMHISNVYCDRAEKVIISLFFQTNSKS